MAKQLQSVTIQAPAFMGLNIQDAPTALSEQFALIADNCVIDSYGRLGARKGFQYLNANTENVKEIFEYLKDDLSTEIITITDTDIYTGTDTLTSIKPVSYTIPTGEVTMINVSGTMYIFSNEQPAAYYDGTTCDLVSNHPSYSGIVPQSDNALSAFGRSWVVGSDNVLYFSDLLLGMQWDTGSSGSIDLTKVWAGGNDEVTGLASHNGFLFIFGRRQIVVYQGASDPATMSLADTINGIGCVSNKTIQPTGNDLLFISETGLRSLNRTIQEKSVPIGDLSYNVRSEMVEYLKSSFSYATVYSPDEAFYLLTIKDRGLTYCFDMRTRLENGSARTTRWNSLQPTAYLYRTSDNSLLLGTEDGLATYTGYKDKVASDGTGGEAYQMSYYSSYLDFGASANLKLLKNIKATFIGGNDTQVSLAWAFDYDIAYRRKPFTLGSQVVYEYGTAEYGIAEYTKGVQISRPSVNTGGAGAVLQFGIDVQVDGNPISLQRLTIQTILGRLI